MANKNTIRVAEFEKLYYDDTKPFKQKHWDALCRYQEQKYKKGESDIEYYRVLNKGVQFTNYVGVIQAGNLTIEVLPKTDRAKTTAANETVRDLQSTDAAERQCWHNVLLQMLKECRLLQVNHVDYANLNLKTNSILEIYIELFLAETEKILRLGLAKKYRKTEGNRYALKGQLQFSKNIAQNLVHQERFYVRYTDYNHANIYNQLLYKTLGILPSISSSPYLTDKANRLFLDFPEMDDCTVNASVFEKLSFDRKTEHYKEPLLISKMLLLDYRPDITGGTENVIAILFDMNKLWEEFVYRRLKKEEANHGVAVNRQQSTDFWHSSLLYRSKIVRPDIVIKKDDEVFVVDTKWKIPYGYIPADSDLKQMFVYNLYWQSYKSVLLYPGAEENCHWGNYSPFEIVKQENKCAVAITNILNEQNLIRSDFGTNLLELIFKKDSKASG